MRFVKFIENDIVDCDEGICVSVWFGYCPIHCNGCHNYFLWDYDKETENEEVINKLIPLISANGINRKLSILGGEPLAEPNYKDCRYIIEKVKEKYPDIKIYLWTGYTIEELKERKNEDIDYILSNIYTLIDGRFDIEKRDITLKLRGSPNQRIFRNIDGKLIEE